MLSSCNTAELMSGERLAHVISILFCCAGVKFSCQQLAVVCILFKVQCCAIKLIAPLRFSIFDMHQYAARSTLVVFSSFLVEFDGLVNR